MKTLKLSLVAAALLLAAPRAQAGSASSQFNVTATVIQNCTISASALAFGSYDPVVANAGSGQNLDTTSTLTVACTKGAQAVTIGLDQGTSTNRTMADTASGGALTYQLYSDSNRTTVWGNTAGSTVGYAPLSRNSIGITVYGRVPGGQDVPVGTGYLDKVTATINF